MDPRTALREAEMSSARALPELAVSIELFPPRSAEAEARFWPEMARLAAAEPAFFSITCGAGGTAREGTFPLALALKARFGRPVAAHLTCAGHSRAEVDALAEAYWQHGIRHLVALRGDPPKGQGRYRPRPDGYAYAAELVAGLRRVADFEISVAGYPETHPEAPSPAFDLENVKRKVDAGAVRVLGQYCFDTEAILRYRDALWRIGVRVPFVPGIMPIRSFPQIRRFSAACGAGIPAWLAELFREVPPEAPEHAMIAAWVAAEQCRRLVAEGFRAFHIYALNRADLTLALLRLLGRPVPVAAPVDAKN